MSNEVSTTGATVNVSLKSRMSDQPWITVQGEPDDVLRVIWKLSPAARKLAEAKDFFGAVYAANAEYQGRLDKPAMRPGVVSGSIPGSSVTNVINATPQQTPQGAVALVEEKLGGTVIAHEGVWGSSPSTPDTSVWGEDHPDGGRGALGGTYGPEEFAGDTDYGPAPQCPHGTMKLVQGTAKTGKNAGKPYTAWACQADSSDPSKCGWRFID